MYSLRRIAVFLTEEDCAQDVAEYCLITALIALVALGIFWHVSGGLQGLWNSMNTSIPSNGGGSSSSPGSH